MGQTKGKVKQPLQEVQIGSVTLYAEPSPPLPDLTEQARTVAEYYRDVEQRLGLGRALPEVLEALDQLATGDVHARFRQRSAEEIEAYKTAYIQWDEHLVALWQLPAEEQLADTYLGVRAQLWGLEHGEHLSWKAWNTIRKVLPVEQAAISEAMFSSLLEDRDQHSASDLAPQIIHEALRDRTSIEQRSLEDSVMAELFRHSRVAHPIHSSYPITLPERIPSWAWSEGLRILVPGYWLLQREADNQPIQLPDRFMPVASARPMMMADRAFRTPAVWSYDTPLPTYGEKKHPGITLTYEEEGSSPEEIRELLHTLNPRTSDIWHLLLAKTLEKGRAQVFQPVQVDVRELARAMGYTPHHKGGMKPRDIDEAARALEHIANTWIEVTPAEKTTLEQDQGNGRRKKKAVTDVVQQKLLHVIERRGQRDLFGTTRFMEWEVALGKWAQHFPVSYAPILRYLVDLPATGKSLWAKQIGKELSFWYREDRTPDALRQRRADKVIRICTLLERACLLPEIDAMRAQGNHKRCRQYFETAMDTLNELGVHEGWHYNAEDNTRLEALAGKPGAFEAWLNVRVELRAPGDLLASLPALPSKSTSRKVSNTPKSPPPS